MGWWKQGDDLLGDGPVDLLEQGLAELSAGKPKPTWQEFANAVAAAINEVPDGMFSDRTISKEKPTLRFHFALQGTELTSALDQNSLALSGPLSEIFGSIAEEYEEHRGRKPTVTEILGTISFSMGVRPERFLSGAAGTSLARISLEPAGS